MKAVKQADMIGKWRPEFPLSWRNLTSLSEHRLIRTYAEAVTTPGSGHCVSSSRVPPHCDFSRIHAVEDIDLRDVFAERFS